jgi:hypothetical protein
MQASGYVPVIAGEINASPGLSPRAMGETMAGDLYEPPPLEHPEVCDVWFWDGDLDHVLSCVKGQEEKYLLEKGVLQQEDDSKSGVKDLVVGDVVYRIRTSLAFEMGTDPREPLFKWSSINPFTMVESLRPVW